MRILYSNNGFEQDNEPQLCLEGTCEEFENLTYTIEESLRNNTFGEIVKLKDHEDGINELVLVKEEGGRKLLMKVDSNQYVISLDSEIWTEVLDLIYPLVNQTGYQFIEFNNFKAKIVEDLGLIFKST